MLVTADFLRDQHMLRSIDQQCTIALSKVSY